MTTRRELTLRTPEDLLAAVPVLLGFVPERSVVMLSLSTPHGPHARVDVVPVGEASALGASLAAAATAHCVDRVALVVVDDDLDVGEPVARVVMREFPAVGVDVAAVLVADGKRWRSVVPRPTSSQPQEYDARHHPFLLRGLVEGRVVHESRDAVRDLLAPDADAVRRAESVRRDLRGRARDTPEWVEEYVARAVSSGEVLDAVGAARLLEAVEDPDNRDAAWSWVARDDARAHLDLWLAAVRACPADDGAAAASLVAFHAWLVGDGALAWCAVDRADAAGGTTLSRLVADLLERAAPPTMWRPLRGRDVAGVEGIEGKDPAA